MIINGGSRSNAAFFAKHLTNGEHNERVTLCEMRGLAAITVPDALREMEAVAMGTLCKNYFYHANINPRGEEELTPEQWQLAADTLEQRLGFERNARFVVEHRCCQHDRCGDARRLRKAPGRRPRAGGNVQAKDRSECAWADARLRRAPFSKARDMGKFQGPAERHRPVGNEAGHYPYLSHEQERQ
jgi:hypothetical protein